jgi:hypothetical protein
MRLLLLHKPEVVAFSVENGKLQTYLLRNVLSK